MSPDYSRQKKEFAAALTAALSARGISVARAAAQGGVPPPTVWRWTHGATLPGRTRSDPELFWSFVRLLRLDPAPFTGVVPTARAEKGRVKTVCPKCLVVRWTYPSSLDKPSARVTFDAKTGTALRLCGRCASAERGEQRRASLYRRGNVSHKARVIVEREVRRARDAGTRIPAHARATLRGLIGNAKPPAKTREYQRRAARQPRPRRSLKMTLAALHSAPTRAIAGGGRLPARRRALTLCLLCGLIVEPRPATMLKGAWHTCCRAAWLRASGQWQRQFSRGPKTLKVPSSAPPKRGRPFTGANLSRDIVVLLRDRAAQRSFPDAHMPYPGARTVAESARELGSTRQNLDRQVARVLRSLPGDWRLVFATMKESARASLQDLCPLPDVLQQLADTRERDGLVRWLSDNRMDYRTIARLTGVPAARTFQILRDRAHA